MSRIRKTKQKKPRVHIDIVQLKALCRMKPTQSDCAAFFKCSLDTIERFIRKETGLTYAEFRDQSMVHTRFDLIRKAIKRSDVSDTMLIFSLKNLCDWSDKLKTENEHSGTFLAEQSDEALEERIKVLEAKREKLKLTGGK